MHHIYACPDPNFGESKRESDPGRRDQELIFMLSSTRIDVSGSWRLKY